MAGFILNNMNNKKARLLRKQAVITANNDNKKVDDVYNGLKKMVKNGIIKFGK